MHRHVCSKNIRLIGITNHPSTGYGPALRLMERYADRYPLEDMVSHEYAARGRGRRDAHEHVAGEPQGRDDA